jgi:Uncharacterised protein family UPF0547/Bacterial PH domain
MPDQSSSAPPPTPARRVFRASRLTRGNRLFPTVIEVTDAFVIKRTRTLFTRNEISMHLQRVASVRIKTGLVWSEIVIESSGGTDPIQSHGHTKADAREIQRLIEAAQKVRLGETVAARTCPFCAETINAAARVCRFCGRELERLA